MYAEKKCDCKTTQKIYIIAKGVSDRENFIIIPKKDKARKKSSYVKIKSKKKKILVDDTIRVLLLQVFVIFVRCAG